MREWNQYCLIDIFSQVDPSLLEENFLEGDLDKIDFDAIDLWPKQEKRWNKKTIALITGIAAGTVALAGTVVYLCARTQKMKKAA